MFCICRSSDGISIRMESASEDQQPTLHAEVWWPESAPKQIHSDSDQRSLPSNQHSEALS